MVEELDAVVRTIAADDAAAERFLAAEPADAVIELRTASNPGGEALRQFLGSARPPRVPRAVHARPVLGRGPRAGWVR